MCPVGGLSNDKILGSKMVDCFQGDVAWLGGHLCKNVFGD